MKRITLSVLTIFCLMLNLQAQTDYFGKPASEIKQWVQWEVESRTGYDSYGNSKGNNVNWDVKYYDGKIEHVVICYYNQYLIDFRLSANFCKYYLMSNGVLNSIATQYENISTSKILSFYNNNSDYIKNGDNFYSSDLKTVSKVYLAKNGQATIEYSEINQDELPYDVQQIKLKREKDKQDEYNRKIAAEQKQKQIELEKKRQYEAEQSKILKTRKQIIYDYETLNSSDYSTTKYNIINLLYNNISNSNNDFKVNCKYLIDTNNIVKSEINFEGNISALKKDSLKKLLSTITFVQPKKMEVNVCASANFNISALSKSSKIKFKYKHGKYKFKGTPPTENELTLIKKDMQSNQKTGIYTYLVSSKKVEWKDEYITKKLKYKKTVMRKVGAVTLGVALIGLVFLL